MVPANQRSAMTCRIPIDPGSDIVKEHYAIVFAPRRNRGRFPEASVEIVESGTVAREGASPENNRYAARLVGPSRSSEGLRLYYLDTWLE